MENKSGVICREAVHADRQGVHDIIPNIFRGVDFVEDQWGEFMANEDFHSYVAVIGDEIVGFYLITYQSESQ